MSKPTEQVRFFRPAQCTRAGLEDRKRVVYHPRRHRGPLKRLADSGEAVKVRPNETLYWRRLLNSGDVIEGGEKELADAIAADKKAKTDAKAKAEPETSTAAKQPKSRKPEAKE